MTAARELTNHQIELDCRRQQCPVPVLRLAKAAAELDQVGGYVLICADDPAFPKDLRAWARSAGARIMRFDDHGDHYEATIRVGVGEDRAQAPPRATVMPPRASQTFDLRGYRREAPLTILARACTRAEPGAVIAIVVDEPSFAAQLERWVAEADATVLTVEHGHDFIEARVRVDPPGREPEPAVALARPAPTIEPATERCTLLVLHNDHEALLAALLIANGAAAQGMDTTVFFTFWGLNLLRGDQPNPDAPTPAPVGFMQRMMKWMMPRGPAQQPLGKMHFAGLGKGMLSAIMRQQQLMGLPELIANAQEVGVRFVACTMSMAVMGIAKRDLHPYPNLEYAGVASFVEDARSSAISLVF